LYPLEVQPDTSEARHRKQGGRCPACPSCGNGFSAPERILQSSVVLATSVELATTCHVPLSAGGGGGAGRRPAAVERCPHRRPALHRVHLQELGRGAPAAWRQHRCGLPFIYSRLLSVSESMPLPSGPALHRVHLEELGRDAPAARLSADAISLLT